MIEVTGSSLAVCTVGGGPGTEILGLCKYIAETRALPTSVRFTVLDRVQEWGDTWSLLASSAEAWLSTQVPGVVPIAPAFYPMDVTDPASYQKLAFLFPQIQMLVFNYLLSENKVRLATFAPALTSIVAQSAPGTVFVFIDRYEASTQFKDDVATAVRASGLNVVGDFTLGGCMNEHPESDLGAYPTRFGRRPRRWFRNRYSHRDEVFVLVGVRP